MLNYKPIENYGLIGNMHSSALVAIDGSIDWMCLPHFDSPSVFASLLDKDRGGYFSITSTLKEVKCKQFYLPDTNLLVTRFLTQDGVGELVDYMPIACPSGAYGFRSLIRKVHSVRGTMPFRLRCCPALDFARETHQLEFQATGARFVGTSISLALSGSIPFQAYEAGVEAEFSLPEGESLVFCLKELQADQPLHSLSVEEEADLQKRTIDYWRSWLSRCTYNGRWREIVHRSALVLKLLTFEPTGAIVAAPSCSLPERIGGGRNWDYRFTWIRDASFTLYALLRIGFTEEAERFMEWVIKRCHELEPDGSLQIMYGIDGRHNLQEQVITELDGYKASKPVRVGNGAYAQLQLDIYGELFDAVYLYNKYGSPISYDLWTHLRRLANWVCTHWQEKDEGIWEVRGEKQHFVYSKVMCWVALDRALRLADKRGFPCDRERWLRARDQIYEEVMQKGWSSERGAFVQYYGGQALDAAALIMPLVFFISPTDPKMLQTLDAINRSPERGGLVSDSLVFRYDSESGVDGFAESEGTFNICTFWLVEALTRAGKSDRSRLDEARIIFEKMLGYANHLGLYGEETGPHGEALGNFPQAFTHLALISAAFNLDRALG